MKVLLIVALVLTLASCSATKPQSTASTDSTQASTSKSYVIFGFTSSGLGSKPSDAIRLDSTRQMTFTTRARLSAGDFKEVTGMAILEDADYAALEDIITRGNLASIDSTDVGVKCPQGSGEMMTLWLKSSDQPRGVTLNFDDCATDYNLLLEPQRRAFQELVGWFRVTRNKYRPYKP